MGEIEIAEDLAGAVDVGFSVGRDGEAGEAFETGWIGQGDRGDGNGFSGRKIEAINRVWRSGPAGESRMPVVAPSHDAPHVAWPLDFARLSTSVHRIHHDLGALRIIRQDEFSIG